MLIAGQPGTGKTAAGLVVKCSRVYQGIDCWIFVHWDFPICQAIAMGMAKAHTILTAQSVGS